MVLLLPRGAMREERKSTIVPPKADAGEDRSLPFKWQTLQPKVRQNL